MVSRKAENWIYIVVPAYLALAITGSSALVTDGAFRCGAFASERPCPAGFFSPIARTVDWFAEDTTTSGKVHEHSPPVPHRGFLSIYALAGIYAAAIIFAELYFLSMKNDNTSIMKNAILLKLRI